MKENELPETQLTCKFLLKYFRLETVDFERLNKFSDHTYSCSENNMVNVSELKTVNLT